MDHLLKKKTALTPAVKVLPDPKVETKAPSLEGKIVLFVIEAERMVDFLTLTDAGKGSAQLDYPSFFANPGRKADILIFEDIQLLWDDANMESFGKALDAFRKANPKSAIIVDASTSPLFKGLTKYHEEGKINVILSSPAEKWGALEVGLEVLSVLRD